jgi:nucleoside-diphosphate-sugar epimerase
MVMSMIRKIISGEVPKLTKGEQMWDYLYSADAAEAMYLLGDKGLDGRVYCLGSGQAKPLYEYIHAIRDAIDMEARIELGAIPYAENQIMYLCADISDLIKDTGFVPQTSFWEGVRKTVEWSENLFK